MNIRAMVPSDIPGVLALVSDVFGPDYAQRAQPEFNETFGSALQRPFYYVAEIEGKIAGLSGYGASWLNYGIYEIFWVGVLNANRGRGVGKTLIKRCLCDLATVADHVILVTDKCEFFKKCGFTQYWGHSR